MVTIEAEDGFVYCDGQSKGKTIYLPDTADKTIWAQMTEEEADALILANSPIEPEEEPEDVGEDATEEDYLAALAELGVSE